MNTAQNFVDAVNNAVNQTQTVYGAGTAAPTEAENVLRQVLDQMRTTVREGMTEIDMHLHPQWARTIIQRLTDTFPNCQFVLTTHSPLVISDSKNMLVYSLDNGELSQLPSQYGLDVNTVLISAMDTPSRNIKIDADLNNLLDLIQDNKLEKARELLTELEEELIQENSAENIELIKARLLLRKQELRGEKN